MNYFNIIEAKKIYRVGKNITAYLRKQLNVSENTAEIIEIAYDLQAGSYIESIKSNQTQAKRYAIETGKILCEYSREGDFLVDVGCGELTRLTFMLNSTNVNFSRIVAFDISWSRLKKGQDFFFEQNIKPNVNIETLVAEIKEIPLMSNSVDIVTSNHALEPNGKNLRSLLKELFRVTRRKLILFEPSYETNTIEGRKRMDELGYIKGMPDEIEILGGDIEAIIPIANSGNPLLPTVCYVINPPPKDSPVVHDTSVLSVPGTDFHLEKSGDFLASNQTGLLFPILEGIPILKTRSAILATAKFDK